MSLHRHAALRPPPRHSSRIHLRRAASMAMEQDWAAAYLSLGWPADNVLPVAYSERYNVTFFGLERLHPFDSCKFRKICCALKGAGVLRQGQIAEAREVDVNTLLSVHDADYLNSLHSSPAKVAEVVELAVLRWLPNFLLQRLLMAKLRHHVGGTMLTVALAVTRGWAVNLGGGFHHAYHSGGMGWCPYSDITLAIRKVRETSGGRVQRVLVIDTDAHQGNGVQRDKLHFNDNDLFSVDLYNADRFPWDNVAKAAIDVDVPFADGADDAEYLARLDDALDAAFSRFTPHLVIHNAGSDILAGDPLGRMSVSASGIAERDWRVWSRCRDAGIPVCMLLSGGYARESANVVVASLTRILQSEQQRSGDAPKQ